MDAIAYQMSFDEGQLALLCANYDRRIDSLDAENKQLQAENAKLRELVRDMVLNMGGCALHGNPLRLREFGSMAIELGIEVVE